MIFIGVARMDLGIHPLSGNMQVRILSPISDTVAEWMRHSCPKRDNHSSNLCGVV